MKKVLVGIMAVAAMLPAGGVRADGFTFPLSICAPGSGSTLYACASASVTFVPASGGGGQLVLQVKNEGLMDSGGVMYLTPGYAITGIGITYPMLSNAAMTSPIVATADSVGTPGDQWSFTKTFDGFTVQAGAATSGGVNGGIWSCYVGLPSDGGAGSEYYRTCGGQYVQFTFDTSSDFTPGALAVSFAMRGQSGEGGGVSYRCAESPNATYPNGNGGCGWGGTNDNTVPEPVSMVLLGSGLLGLAGVRNWRRRSR